jgi:hypothetical protein
LIAVITLSKGKGVKIMLKINEIENACKSEEAFKKANINNTFYWAYRRSVDKGLDIIDFTEVIWPSEIDEIISQLKKYEIKQFALSTTFSGLLETVQSFIDKGCTLGSMIKLEGTRPALLIKL